jgi:UDP-N-acetylmuramate: L-alanyl-gamma-D-glutamyl-meso-diaminopimelate ligase
MRIHLIAIGGAVMHNLAIALKNKGYMITGSDDEIFEPSKSRLHQNDLLPEKYGWFAEKITPDIDGVILGMHAHMDNPELLRAQQFKIPVYSFPQYIYEQSKNKLRIAVCGSHGKTTITSMVMHVLKSANKDFDYLAGAQLEGFNEMVKLTEAPMIVIEGDEYFASVIDKRPKFLFYQPQTTLISGIAWDHFNVFPSFENYLQQFKMLMQSLPENSTLIYNSEDENITGLLQYLHIKAQLIPYKTPEYTNNGAEAGIYHKSKLYTFNIFGKHNMQNMVGALCICKQLNIDEPFFYHAMQTFKGAARRLEMFKQTDDHIIFRDFAHSPSKVEATVKAVKEQYPHKKLIACLELHTYSSLNKEFLGLYADTMQHADIKIVYFNPHTLSLKKLPELKAFDVKKCFNDKDMFVMDDSQELLQLLKENNTINTNILLMSSGNFSNLDFSVLN